MMRRILGASLVVLAAGVARGQSAPAPLTFEVASIKPSGGDDHRVGIRFMPGGGLQTTGTTLKFLLTFAYDAQDFQISGGPGWISSDRFDIVAKSERANSENTTPDDPRKMTDAQMKTSAEQMQQKLQALLADRFHLTIHHETKEQTVYALVIGKNGSKLQESQAKQEGRRMSMRRGELSGDGVPLEMLVSTLSRQLGRTLASGFNASPTITPNTFAIDPNFRIGYNQNWQVSVQRDIPGALVLTVMYLGSKGTRAEQMFLPNTYPLGAVNPCPTCPAGFEYVTSNGNSTREAGQVQLRRRLRSGFTASLQYTYSKSIDDAALGGRNQGTAVITQNWLDLSTERGLSNFDQRHLLDRKSTRLNSSH